MIKGKGVLFLDGDFSKRHPQHGQHSKRYGGKWFIYRYGPTYANTYEVTEYDADGQRELEAAELKAPGSPEGSESK